MMGTVTGRCEVVRTTLHVTTPILRDPNCVAGSC